MRLSLDGKSVAVGLFAGAALVASIGAAQNDSPEVGRFQIAAAGGPIAYAYVLDTATGKVWKEHSNDAFSTPKLDAAQ